MNTIPPLPNHPDAELAELAPDALLALMIADEDRVPRNVVDECARRGDAMTECLSSLVENSQEWSADIELGTWWLRLHAVMILGLIETEAAGLLLIRFMRRMSQANDDSLQDWLAGYWPALFRNKPESILPPLRDLAEDRSMHWYMRATVLEAYVAAHQAQGQDALAQALAWVAGIAGDEQEEWNVRLLACSCLLDFPRPQYRPLLESLADRQSGRGMHFSRGDIRLAYAGETDKPGWERFSDPWRFYRPAEIIARQARWVEEDTRAEMGTDEEDDEFFDSDAIYADLPYVRADPKVGRNDPCPCGSGKKYKKCCLA